MKSLHALKSVLAVAVISVLLFSACAAKKDSVALFKSNVEGKNWQLALVKAASDNNTVIFDFKKQDPKKFSDIYTIMFDGEKAFGKAAPNRYIAPYTLGKDFAITFKPIAGTLMMGIFTPEGLSEHEYFQLLQNVSSWKLNNDAQLILNSGDKVLIFAPTNIPAK